MPNRDNDDAFDENGVLKDGRSFKVDVRLCDAMSKEVAKHAAKPTKQHITDAYGNDGLALHRPGARVLAGGSARTQQAWDQITRVTEDAYALDDQYKTNAWKAGDDDDDSLLDADFEDGGNKVDEYARYDADLRNAWRRG